MDGRNSTVSEVTIQDGRFVARLEGALRSARDALERAKGNISPKVYAYLAQGNANSGQRTVHAVMDSEIADIQKVLG